MSEPTSSAADAGVGKSPSGLSPGGMLWFLIRNIEEIIGCIGMCVTILVVSVNVALRYLFSQSMSWTEEVAVIGFSCVIFLGSAAVYKRGVHVGIDFVVNCLPENIRRAIAFLTLVFLMVFNGWLTYLGWVYAVESWEKPTSILFIPYFFVNLPICLGFGSMTVYSVVKLVAAVRGRAARGGDGEGSAA